MKSLATLVGFLAGVAALLGYFGVPGLSVMSLMLSATSVAITAASVPLAFMQQNWVWLVAGALGVCLLVLITGVVMWRLAHLDVPGLRGKGIASFRDETKKVTH